MYRFDKEQLLDPQFLSKLVDKFASNEVPKFERLERYYRNKTDIYSRVREDEKPNNKLAHPFCRYITNMATSYFMGKSVQYDVEDVEYKEALLQIYKENYIDSLNFELSKEASKKGIAFEMLFIDEKGKLNEQVISAEGIIPVYSNKLGEFLEAAVRIWSDYDIDGVLLKQYAEVITDTSIIRFERMSYGALFQKAEGEDAERKHYFKDVPVIVVWNNEEQMGDYEPVMELVNAYDKVQSDTANDSEYFTDAYLCITGAGGGLEVTTSKDVEDEEAADLAARSLRKNRILYLDEHGQAEWLTKNVNDTAQENYKNRLKNDIFFLSQVPALSDESFAGNLTGVAIKYKLIGLEELSVMKEAKFDAALRKRDKLVTEYLNLHGNDWNCSGISHKFERNFIENDSDLIEDASKLEGMVSKRTQLTRLPSEIVPDVDSEIETINRENLQQEGLPYAEV